MLPAEAISEFKNIYKSEFGIELSDEDATEKATALMSLFKVLARHKKAIDSLEWKDQYQDEA